MASGNLSLTVRLDTYVLEARLRALTGWITATDPVDRLIERLAFEALCETRRMADQARADLGLLQSSDISVRILFEAAPAG